MQSDTNTLYVMNFLTERSGKARLIEAVQRTRLYHTNLDIQRGILVGLSYKKVDFTTYVFNLGWTDPTVVLAVGVSF